ncbi:MAG: protein-export chaperone SecB [Gammaproteobacteria bacterium]|jgi:preprotein translocase subunit SecB|nr:protein-export chaperone SecB [Gammaproteobacteria bacterium]
MTSDSNATTGNPIGDRGPQMAIQRIYVKDLSFETPAGPDVLAREGQAQAQAAQEMGIGVRRLEQDRYEVMLTLTVTLKDGAQTLYLVEIHQAGVFMISGLGEAELTQVLNVHCPTVLFPYAREAVDSTVMRGGFPPLLLPPVNFDGLYRQAAAQRAASGTAA